MTKEEKQNRKHLRCLRRKEKRYYFNEQVRNYVYDLNVSYNEARKLVKYGSFQHNGVYLQVCSYWGLCAVPCCCGC